MDSPQPPPRPSTDRRQHGGCISILLAFALLSIVVTLMLMLPMGNIGVAVLMFVGLFVVVATVHYVVWGRLITQMIEQERAAARDADIDDS